MFDVVSQNLLLTKAALIALLTFLSLYWIIGLLVKIWHRHIPNWNLCKVADQNRLSVLEKGACSDSNLAAQSLQMAMYKSLEMIFGMILNRSQPKFAAKLAENEMFCLSKVQWSRIDKTSFSFQFKDFWVISY